MDYGPEDLGPALMRLRKAAGLRQGQVAETIGRSVAAVSRIEQSGSNPNATSLLRYLAAVGADLADLDRELSELADPLDELVVTVDRKLREDPGYRRLARGMLERFGDPEPPPALRALADLIDRQGEQLADYGERLRRLEGDAGDDPPAVAGADSAEG